MAQLGQAKAQLGKIKEFCPHKEEQRICKKRILI